MERKEKEIERKKELKGKMGNGKDGKERESKGKGTE